MKQITIYTDGSSKGNPGPGGWAAIVLMDKEKQVLSGNEQKTTNNRMELLAIVRAFEWISENVDARDIPVSVNSDSNLIIQTMNEGWKTKKNIDLWEALGKAIEGWDIEWKWVKGHSTNKLNNECDRIAQEEADKVEPTDDEIVADSNGEFFCENCNNSTEGILTQKTPDSPIRVDCTHCGKYIKFASKTKANLERVNLGSQDSLF